MDTSKDLDRMTVSERVIAAIEEGDRALVQSPGFERLLLRAQQLGLWPEFLRPLGEPPLAAPQRVSQRTDPHQAEPTQKA